MEQKKYGSPRPQDEKFSEFWLKFIDKVVSRENFHESHLQQLELLIDLYIEYDKLTEIIEEEGLIYHNTGRYGHSIKPHPAVQLRQKTVSEIRAYSKLLDLVLAKDNTTNEPEDDEWE